MSVRAGLSLISKLLALTSVVWLTPPRYWHWLAGLGISRGEETFRPFYRRALKLSDEELLTKLCVAHRRSLRENRIQVIGAAGPWRRWRPTIRLHGVEHLEAALRNGRGVILWAANFIYSDLIYKLALHDKGYLATQLYRPEHGFGGSKLEIRLLNPIWMAVEGRFLRHRVMIYGNDTAAAINVLRSRLGENEIVVVYIGNEGRRTTEVPFMNHRIRLATGPVAIACSTRAALVPLFVVKNADETFDVTLEEPLEVPLAGDGAEKFDNVAAAMARRLEPYARSYPEQWRAWNELIEVGVAEAGIAAGNAAPAAP